MEYGTVQRAMLGIRISDLTPEVAKENNLNKINGVYVEYVLDGSSADDAGLRKGDIILSVDGKSTNTVAQLQEQINRFRPGDQAEVKYSRDGSISSTLITFKNVDNNTALKNRKLTDVLGATFEEKDGGVQITELRQGKLMSAGIRNGFIITEINNRRVRTTEDIEKIIGSVKGGVYIGGVYPNGQAAYYAFGME
jgi:S1-C subfamily serine protease